MSSKRVGIRRKPNYGIDAPGVVRNIAVIAGLGAIVAFVPLRSGVLVDAMQSAAFWVFVWCTLSALVMLSGSLFFKLRLRDRVLDSLNLRGDERVLDVGCGSGLLLLGAAKRLTTGRAIGLDRWQAVDQSGNGEDRTRANAQAEGVSDRIEIVTGDMRTLPFEESSFDVVLSSWAIHNLPESSDRTAAIDEIVRVLAPGGRIAIADIGRTGEYVSTLRAAGLDATRSGPNFLFVTPTRVVRAQRPATVR